MDRNARLSVALLGSFEIIFDGRPVTAFESVKVRALLAYLAVEAGRSHARAFLAELLWPELPAATALTYLRHVLAQLKQAIPEATSGGTSEPPSTSPGVTFLNVTRDTVAFNPDSDYRLDIAEFTSLLEATTNHAHRHAESCVACARRRAAAVALYRGDFLSHLVLGDSAAFEEWAALKRERLRQQALEALTRLAAYFERRGAYADAERAAWRLLELDPWRDEAYCRLMRVLWLSGQRSAALTTYDRCRQILRQDLGVEPATATTGLYERIRDAAPDTLPEGTPPHVSPDLPAQTTSLVGRETELLQVVDLLQQPRYRLVTLTGAGGIGKTRLALAVAAELHGEFADGVRFVALAPVSNPALVIPAVASVLGVAESRSQPLIESLKIHLRAKQLLLVLDNFEHVAAAALGIAELLGAAPHLTVLVTSRAVLRVYGEQEFPVPPLGLPDLQRIANLDQMRRSDAVQLFVARAQAVQPDFAITGETAAVVGTICHRLEGLPLAIELAAARSRVFAPAAMLERLNNPLRLLTGGAYDLPARQQTLRATIDWSYRLLTAEEQRLVARLAVFKGGWTLEAAEAICCAGDGPSSDMLDALESLVAQSLVRRQATWPAGSASIVRFGMFEMIRDYALERLEASGKAGAMRTRHVHFFRDLAETAEPHLRSAEQVRWLPRLDVEHPNIRAALAWALKQGLYEDALRLATATTWFWHLRGHDREAYGWLRRLLAPRQGVAPETRARALPMAAFFANILGDLAQAQAWSEAGINLSRETGDLGSLAYSLIMLSWSEPDEGQRVAHIDQALAAAQQVGDPWWVAMAIWFKGETYKGRDDEHVQALLETSLPLFRRFGEAWSLGWNLGELGEVVYRRGDYERAAALFEESLTRLTAIGHNTGIAFAQFGLGNAAYDQGQHARAAGLLDEALGRFREAGHPLPLATVLIARGKVALAQGDVEHAGRLVEESLALAQAFEMRTLSTAQHLLGRVALARRELARARALLTESFQRRRGSAAVDLLESLDGLAELAVAEAHEPKDRFAGVVYAVRLLGAVAAARTALNIPRPPGDRAAYERDVAAVRGLLDAAAWQTSWAEGQAMTLEQAVAYALEARKIVATG